MKIKVIPQTSNYVLEREYLDKDNDKEIAEVILHIDWKTRRFSVLPKGNGKEFVFIDASQNYGLWLAVTELIHSAILFANDKLGIVSMQYQEESNTQIITHDHPTKVNDQIDDKPTLLEVIAEEKANFRATTIDKSPQVVIPIKAHIKALKYLGKTIDMLPESYRKKVGELNTKFAVTKDPIKINILNNQSKNLAYKIHLYYGVPSPKQYNT